MPIAWLQNHFKMNDLSTEWQPVGMGGILEVMSTRFISIRWSSDSCAGKG